ncbi:MAG TPA: hypothetical protein VG498_15025 [Terriglobales bacterium]|nr:hypothetical protein [Terriglobales bacterium]
MKQFLLVVIAAVLVWSGCGSKKSTTTTGVAITISPTSASVAGGATQQFTATVTGSTNTAVTWQVNGTTGGDAINGTISTTGLYTAPNVLPSNTSITVTAIAQADTTKTAAATVTLTAPSVTISISPTSATLAAGAKLQFNATVTVTGSTNNAVTWSVNGVTGGDAIHGTIDANGLYTAPLSPSPQAGITVRATSQANTSFSAAAPVTVQFGNASLTGTYVFLIARGDNSSGTGFAYRGGAFVADGKGNITSGVNDANSGSGALVNAAFTGTGTYSVGTDGRGTLTFTDSSGSHTFTFALTSNSRGQIVAADSGAVTSGFVRLQTAIASPSGPYVFSLTGDNAGPTAAIGQISFSGALITGNQDVNLNGAISQGPAISGSVLSLDSGTGRGMLQLNSSNYAFYVIDASTVVLVDTDPSGTRVAGTAYGQSGTFTSASLGTSAYLVSGVRSSDHKPYMQAGRFDTDAVSKLNGGVFDANSAGTLTLNSTFPFSAGYTLSASGSTAGRGTISTGTSTFIFWLASPKMGVIMEADPPPSNNPIATGLLLQQQTGFQQITGGFAFLTSGFDVTGATALASDGQFSTTGFGVLSGTQDLNAGGSLSSPPFNGNLTIGANGRGTGNLATPNFIFYFVNPNRFLMMTSDPNADMRAGVGERQCSDCTF